MIEELGSGLSLGFLIFLVVLIFGVIVWTVRLMLIPSLERRVVLLLRGQKWEDVRRLITDHLEHGGKAGFLIYDSLGRALAELGEYHKALEAYRQSLNKLSSHSRLYHSVLERIAEIYLKLKQSAEAIAHYLMILSDEPNQINIIYQIALIHFQQHNYKKSREYLERILRIKPGLIDARYLLGKVFYETGNHAYSFKQLKLVSRYDSDKKDVIFYQARNLEMTRHYTDAVENYLLYLNQDIGDLKKNRQAMLSVVRLLIKLKDYLSGLTRVQMFLELPLDRSLQLDLMYLKANLLWHVGEEYRSLVEYRRVNEIKTDYKDTSLIVEKYKDYLECPELEYYLTGSEDNFDFTCRAIMESMLGDLPIPFRRMHRGTDYYIFHRGNAYQVFFRHLESVEFSQLTDVEILIESQDQRRFSVDIFAISGVSESAITHALAKRAHVFEGKHFLKVLKKAIQEKKDAK